LIRYGEEDGSGNWSSISTGIDVVSTLDLKEVNGQPAMLYKQTLSDRLDIARYNGSSWDVTSIDEPNIGVTGGLEIVVGRPAVVYGKGGDGLVYRRSSNESGTVWGKPKVTIESSSSVNWLDMAIVDGRPAVAYRTVSNDIMYAIASDSKGNLWPAGNIKTVDTGMTGGQRLSLAEIDGRPAISYWDGDNSRVLYIRADDSTGSSWTSPSEVVDSSGVGKVMSLIEFNGNPAIAYTNTAGSALYYAENGGSGWNTVDVSGLSHFEPTLLLVDGRPAITTKRGGGIDYCRMDELYGISSSTSSSESIGNSSSSSSENFSLSSSSSSSSFDSSSSSSSEGYSSSSSSSS
jgi:hypothetical protein